MMKFSRDDVERFLDRWIRAVHELSFDGPLDIYHTAARQLEELSSALATNANLDALSRTPILLTAIALVHHNRHGLPAQRAVLYDDAVSVLLRRFDHHAEYTRPAVRAHLAEVAWRLTEAGSSSELREEASEEEEGQLASLSFTRRHARHPERSEGTEARVTARVIRLRPLASLGVTGYVFL